MPPEPDDLTLSQAQRLGDHLLPRFREVLREELKPIDKRVHKVERIQGWAVAIYGGAATVVTLVMSFAGNWVVTFVKAKARAAFGV